MRKNILCFFLTFYFFLGISQVWQADLEDGNFKNPIIYADYSDPDVVKVGDNLFMTASCFNCIPALPILHSKDLVNWEIINYAIKNFPDTDFDIPQHGNGVWAPSIRFINGYYYIYYQSFSQSLFTIDHSPFIPGLES